MNYELNKQTQFYIGKGVRAEAESWLTSQGVAVPSAPGRCLHRL
jgi:hypothetical protein